MTTNWFVFVVPSEWKDDVLLTIKHFTNVIEAPHEIIMDTNLKEASQKIKVLQ